MNIKFFLAASGFAIAASSTVAHAQSTGSIDFNKEIVVTGTRGTPAVAGVSAPDSAKAVAVLTQEMIQHQGPGQSILDTINLIPGVSFQNNDAYGSSGGTLNIRGFDASRVALLVDGVPLNDSGNYAIYSNQQVDPLLLDRVQVNIGTTDVDSPTPSAVGGTVNYITKTPDHDFGALMSGSVGQFDFMRMFAKIETGDLTSSGTRAWFALGRDTNKNPFNNYGKVDKQSYDAKIYQPIGGRGDFIAIAGNYNSNKNNFFGSVPLRTDLTQTPLVTTPRVVGSASSNRFPTYEGEAKYNIAYPCTTAAATPGVADGVNACGTEFDRRYNPSNTGTIRGSSKFHLSDKLVLTVDPFFEYVKANGGGTVTGLEQTKTIAGNVYTGFIGGSYYFGTDLNGDGDKLDKVTVLASSETQTSRVGVNASLRYDIGEHSTVRVAYTYDRARHHQTGEVTPLNTNGEPVALFPIDAAVSTSQGFLMEKRNRLSYAILHQLSGEYRGEFMDSKLMVNAGIRAPFFKRNLDNFCFTTSAGGFVDCTAQDPAVIAAYAAANPTYAAPQQRTISYSKVLPNIGFVYHLQPSVSLFSNYSKGLSVPGTDNLYNAFYFAANTPDAKPAPESTDNFDLGLRYRSGRIQGEVSGFYTQFQNRLASAYDPVLLVTVYRNLGSVKKYGIDGYLSFDVVPEHLNLYVFGSVLKSEIKDNVQIGKNADGSSVYAPTAGKFESGAPNSTLGVSARATEGPFQLGITAKRTGARYIYDTNQAVYTGYTVPAGALTGGVTPVLTTAQQAATAQVYGAQAPAYWLVNLDAKIKLSAIGLNDKSYLQLNVYNLFNQLYVGGFTGNLIQTTSATGPVAYGSVPNVQIGAPRTISGTLTFAF